MHIAECKNGNITGVKFIIRRNIQMGMCQAKTEYVQIHFNTLGEDGSTIENSNKELLEKAKNGNLTGVEFILRHSNGTDINTEDSAGYTPLIWASMKGHLNIVQLLLEEEDIDINKAANDGTPGPCHRTLRSQTCSLPAASRRAANDATR